MYNNEEFPLDQWREDIRAKKASGMTVRDWCRSNHLSVNAYYRHFKHVREADRALSSSNAAPIEGFLPAILPQPKVAGAALRIQRGDTVIEVASDAPEAILSMVREVLSDAL